MGKVLDLSQYSQFDPSHTYTIAAGVPVLRRDFRQSVVCPETLIRIAKEREPHFLKEMYEIAASRGLKVVNPGVKSIERLITKALAEKNGDVGLVYDPLRVALVGETISKIKKGMDFFAPDKNSRTMEFLDEFAEPDRESGMRRGKIVYDMGEGLLAEVQIWSDKMRGAFDDSHKPFERRRTLASQLKEHASVLPTRLWNSLHHRVDDYDAERISIHEMAAEKAGLNKLLKIATYGTINGNPFAAISNCKDSFPILIRPDLKTATYVEDNALYTEYAEGGLRPMSREQFLIASQGMVWRHHKELAQQQSRASTIERHFA